MLNNVTEVQKLCKLFLVCDTSTDVQWLGKGVMWGKIIVYNRVRFASCMNS